MAGDDATSGPTTAGADAVRRVKAALDPVLAELGFSTEHRGAWNDVPGRFDPTNPAPVVDGQVIYCRPMPDASAGCDDVVVDLRATPTWHIVRVRDWDIAEQWTVDYDVLALDDCLVLVVDDVRARVIPAAPPLAGGAASD